MYMDWLPLWYKHTAHVIPSSSSLAFDTNMSEECKSASPNAVQVKNWWKTINIEEKLDIISQREKGEQICYICHNVWYARISVLTTRDNAVRSAESAKSGAKVFV